MFPQIFGKYVLERELASGGMARVFLATLRGAGGFEKRLVVKQIRPELASDQSFIQRFVAEAKTTVELSHANIVPVYELGAEQGTYYIAMEYCAGVSLAELSLAGGVSPEEGAYIGVEICRALDYAHRKAGVVHRDVTPRNVMIDPEGMVRLIDFGIAAPASADRSSGPSFGSPGHMPPEQLGTGPLTPAADVFAVGVLLVEAWTGRAPFRRESLQASARALREVQPRLSESDARLTPLEPLIRSALSHAASDRPQTAEELARPLREFLRRHDLGDLARRLGERVSERLRDLSSASAEASPGAPSSAHRVPRGSTPSGSNTQTFAARGALLEWTAKIESAGGLGSTPPPSATPASLELESGMTAPQRAGDGPHSGWSQRRWRLGGAVLAACALWLAAVGGRRWLDASAAAGTLPEPASARDRIEDRAAERGVPVAPGEPRAAAAPRAASVPRVAAAPPVAEPIEPIAARGGAAPVPRRRDQDRSATDVATGRGREPKAGPSAPAAPRRASREPASAVARLQLTADPAAWVEVDAVRVGRTPLSSHSVGPGRHTIAFVSQLLGERLEASVTLDARQVARVHADFTSAHPRLYVR